MWIESHYELGTELIYIHINMSENSGWLTILGGTAMQ